MTYNILSLSGGGFLGLYSVSVLAAIERDLGRPISTCFDLIAGTSVGAIIALGLARDVPAAEIKAIFEQDGPNIFSDRPAPRGVLAAVDLLRSASKPKYRADALRRTVTKILGAETCIADLKRRVAIPVVNLSKGAPQVFKTPHHPTLGADRTIRLQDAAVAAAAAPTYFPIAEIGDALFADGGLFANNPDMVALHEARHFQSVKTSDVRLLSIGTTSSQFSFAHATGRDLGIIQWGTRARLVNVMIASQQTNVVDMVRHTLAAGYLRIDAVQSMEQAQDLGLDVATQNAAQTLRALAEASAQAHRDSPLLRDIVASSRQPLAFNDGIV